MRSKGWLWRFGKLLIVAIILYAVGRQFYGDLRRLDWQTLEFHPGWLLAAAALYLVGLGFSGYYWYRLLRRFGEQPPPWSAVRAYYVGHLGKYVPGKAIALVLRASLVSGHGVRFGVAVLAAFYEVLTTMAAGALLAAIVFVVRPPRIPGIEWDPLFTGLLLLAVAGVPVMPAVFNRVVGRLARRFESVESFKLPQLRFTTLLEGLLLASPGWVLLALSTWCVLNAVLPQPAPLTMETAPQLLGAVSLAYVAGFLALIVPGGIGIREYLLLQLLSAFAPEALLALAIVLLRLAWTAAEVIMAGGVYFIMPRASVLSE